MPQLPEMIKALLEPKAYPEATKGVALMQTQMSFAFLTDNHVYKVKKPVDLGYLDYTTLEKRQFYCHREVELNRRLSPDVYLEVVPITRDRGNTSIKGQGTIVEYAVKMRRISAFGGLDTIKQNTEENFTQTEKYIGNTISQEKYAHIKNYTETFIERNTPLFHKRIADGNLSIEEIFKEAKKRNIALMSITDHDSIDGQEKAIALAGEYGIAYITGVELNVTFQYPSGKSIPLDFLGFRYDINNEALITKLQLLREHRERRAEQILEKLNVELAKENIKRFTDEDLRQIQSSVDGAFGRPHIADYLVKNGIVNTRQEAFDKYLVKCDVPKYPLSLAEVSELIRNAGGVLVHAHPNDPNGTSLVSITPNLNQQTDIIERYMLNYIDGIECWHLRHDARTTGHYIEFARKHGLIMTGGSDCHQKPILIGTVDIPDWVAAQFQLKNDFT
ncbi:PHP domain-containing protein [Chloroflexota bacterium]